MTQNFMKKFPDKSKDDITRLIIERLLLRKIHHIYGICSRKKYNKDQVSSLVNFLKRFFSFLIFPNKSKRKLVAFLGALRASSSVLWGTLVEKHSCRNHFLREG